MNTLGNITKTKIPYKESRALALGFPTASDLSLGQVVMLNNTGEVDKVASSTSLPLGVVIKSAKTGDRATILTSFCAKISATAHADITLGNELSIHEYDATNTTDKYKPAAAADFVVGIALSGATSGNSCEIGILRSSYKK